MLIPEVVSCLILHGMIEFNSVTGVAMRVYG